jgi:HAD superfamily hydrolase (TIGR01490 family)
MQLAIFDLDGTITRHDTLVPYVFGFLARHPWRMPRLALALPAAIRFAFERDRGQLKSALIQAALGGVTRSQLSEWNATFIPALLAGGTFERARERINAHRSAGDRLILMSASVDLYVPEIGRALGFEETICTQVRWHDDDTLDGSLSCANRRGEEKTRCLAQLRLRNPGMKASAYGNAASDIDHLARVELGVLVNGSPDARQDAAQHGIRCERWS